MAKRPTHPSLTPEEIEGVAQERSKMLFALRDALRLFNERGGMESESQSLIKLSHGLSDLGKGRVQPFLKKFPVHHIPGKGSYEAQAYAFAAALIDLWISPKRADQMKLKDALKNASELLNKYCEIECTAASLNKRREKILADVKESTQAAKFYRWAKKLISEDDKIAEEWIVDFLRQK